MPADFPILPALNETYSYGSNTWTWNGTSWNLFRYSFNQTGATGPTGPTGPTGIDGTNIGSPYFSVLLPERTLSASGSYSINIPAGTYIVKQSSSEVNTIVGSTTISGIYNKIILSSSASLITIYQNSFRRNSWRRAYLSSNLDLHSTPNAVFLFNLYTTDGLTTSLTNSGINANAATFGNGIYVLGNTSGAMRTSTSLNSGWTTQTSGFGISSINALTYGNGIYVAGGSAGTMTISTDSITWTTVTSGFGTSAIRALTYGNGVYVAVGVGGTITTSTDAVTWTTRTSQTILNLTHIVYGNNLYVSTSLNSSTCVSSTDGITWTTRSINGSAGVVAYFNGNFWFGSTSRGFVQFSNNPNTTSATNQATANPISGNNFDKIGATNNFITINGSNNVSHTSVNTYGENHNPLWSIWYKVE
jgi:hypothetical protein